MLFCSAPTSVQFPYLVDDEDSSFQESFSEPQENALTQTGQIFNVKWKNTVITPALKLKNLYTWCHMGIQRVCDLILLMKLKSRLCNTAQI